MRRAVFCLAALAALAGCGGSGSGSDKHTVTLQLRGAAGNRNQTACAKQEPFFLYSKPGEIAYSGRVTPAPSGRWKVKVKVKRCSGGKFVETTSQKIVGQSSGRFDGAIRVGEPGLYSMRAKLEVADNAYSDKAYFRIG